MVFGRFSEERNQDLWVLTLDTSDVDRPKVEKSEVLLSTPARETGAEISPDGRWLAYSSNDSGRAEIFVRPFAGEKITGEGKWQVSAVGGAYPAWSRTGRQLHYMAPDTRMMVADYMVDGANFRPLKPRPWADKPIGSEATLAGGPLGLGPRPFNMAADSQRIVTRLPAEPRNEASGTLHLNMLVNWFDEVNRRMMPGGR